MKIDSKYIILGDASIRIDKLTLRPWPDFSIQGWHPDVSHALAGLIHSDDPLAMIWRGKIPNQVLKFLKRYPQILWRGLLEVSQLDPLRFVHLSHRCPALVALMAMHMPDKQTDRDLDRLQILQQKRSSRLNFLGLPPTREAYRILAKLTIEDCYPVQLEQLRQAINQRSHRRLIRYLKEINTWTLSTLQLPIEFLDVNLLSMQDSEQMPVECNNLAELCREIVHYRQVLNRFPVWPYKGTGVTLHKLIQARNDMELELSLGRGTKNVRLPSPPLESINSSRLKIEPLTTVRALFKEGSELEHCIMTYARTILDGTHYAYRMTHPRRATVLLVKRESDWFPVQIRGPKNCYLDTNTIDLIHTWAGTQFEHGKEATDDFPF